MPIRTWSWLRPNASSTCCPVGPTPSKRSSKNARSSSSLAANQAPELQRVQRQIASLEKQDANPRRALRTGRPNAAERMALEIDVVAAEMRQAVAKRDDLEHVRKPLSTSTRFVQQTMDEMTGLIESSALDTRVAWVRDLPDRVTVDGRAEHAVAIWRTATDDGVNRSDSVSSWLRR